jgi:hypothetical protein
VRLIHSTRLVASLLAAAALGTTGVAAAAPSPSPGTCPTTVEGEVGTWVRRPAPATPSGLDRIRAHAVHPEDPTRHLITDGVSILRTVDDGCAWEPTFTLPDSPSLALPASTDTDRIYDLVAHPTDADRVWAVVAIGQTIADERRPNAAFTPGSDQRREGTSMVVLRSDDGGRTWDAAGSPPLLPGAPIRLVSPAADPDVVYLSANGVLHVSSDGGDSWTPRPTPVLSPESATDSEGRPYPHPPILPLLYDLAADPRDPAVLFTRTRDHAFRSDDAGVTWTMLPPAIANAPAGPFAERWPTDAGPRVLYVHQVLTNSFPRGAYRYRASEGGGELQELAVPDGERLQGGALDAAWHPSRDEVLVATWANHTTAFERVSLYLFDLSDRSGEATTLAFTEIDELRLSPLLGVDVDGSGTYHVHSHRELVSLRTSGSIEDPATDDDPNVQFCDAIDGVPSLSPAEPTPPEPAELRAPEVVTVPVSGSREVAVALDLPARPRPLDLYFLLDTSNGFRDDIGDVARSMADVVETLADAGVDARFGLGGLGTTETYRYLRIVDIAPAGEELRAGLQGLCARGSHESHLVALHQTATGAGVPDGGRGRRAVPPGQDPTWREGSLRTVLLVTDNEFDDRTLKENDPDAPPRSEVFDAFVERDLRFVGVEVVRDVVTPLPTEGQEGTPGWLAVVEAADAAGETAPTPAREDMEALARVTGTFAPPGGVDCRGTGRTELAEGDPLVCTTFSTAASRLTAGRSTMGEVLQRVLLAQEDRQPVEVVVAGDPGLPVEVTHDRGDGGADVRRDHVGDDALDFRLTVGCEGAQQGERFDVELAARVSGQVVATAETIVACGVAVSGTAGGDDGPAPAPDDPARDPAPAPAAPPASGGTPAPAPIGGQAPAPAPVPGQGTAPAVSTGQAPAAASGQAPSMGAAAGAGQAATPGTTAGATQAPASSPGEAGAATVTPSAGAAEQASAGQAAALDLEPADQQRPEVAVATSPAGGAQLAFVAASSRTRSLPASTWWMGAAAGGFATALALGGRRSTPRPARARD